MTIFRIDLCHSYIKIHSKTHKIAPFEKKYQGSMPPNPPNKHVTHTTRPNSKKFDSSPLANPVYAQGLISPDMLNLLSWLVAYLYNK